MSTQPIYSIESLMAQTRKLASQYYMMTQKALPVSGELARYDACALLGLTPSESLLEGVDAMDANHQGIQVKARVLFRDDARGYRIGHVNLNGAWQSVLLVLYNAQYEPISIYAMSREHYTDAISTAENDKREKRGSMSVAKFKAIADCVWPI